MPKENIAALVAEAFALRDTVSTAQARLKEIDALLIAQGAGRYLGEGGKGDCTVIVPKPSIKLAATEVEAAQKIAGDEFSTLFERTVSYAPKKAFRELVVAVLTPGKAKKLIALLEKTSTAFVKWAK